MSNTVPPATAAAAVATAVADSADLGPSSRLRTTAHPSQSQIRSRGHPRAHQPPFPWSQEHGHYYCK